MGFDINKKEKSHLCPIKKTNIYPSVCKKDCTYLKEKCPYAPEKRGEK